MHGALARHACTLLQRFRHELGMSGAIRSLSSSTSASTAAGKQPQQAEHNAEPENEVDDDIAHSTGEERAELEARREGADPFVLDHQWIFSPPGTHENPVQVTSSFTSRIVGAPDPDDDMIIYWGEVKEGDGPTRIGDEFFVLKRIADEHSAEHH